MNTTPQVHYEYEWTITIGATASNNGVETSVQACVCDETTGTPRVSTAGLSYTLINGSTTEYEVAAGIVTSGAVVIASKYEGLPVTAIAGAEGTLPNYTGSFANKTAITSVIIPDSIETIGVGVFASCSNLGSVKIGSSVTSIGEDVFLSCTVLTGIIIPNSVTSIGERAFYGCTSLTSVEIGTGITSIGNHAFAYNKPKDDYLNVTIYAEIPPELGVSVFSALSTYGTHLAEQIKVPSSSVDAYKSALNLGIV